MERGVTPGGFRARCVIAVFVAAVLFIATVIGSEAVSGRHGPKDRTPPTAPMDLRVLATTSLSVSLAWNPSTDNSGVASYIIQASNSASLWVPHPTTNAVFVARLEGGFPYSFYAYAVDLVGLSSSRSNTVTVTLPRDTVPPTSPVVSVTAVGPTHVSLSWSSTDDGPVIFYQVFLDGVPVTWAGTITSATITPLAQDTTYTFTVQARDNGINWSPFSEPISVRTEPRNPDDTTPPSAVTGLTTNGLVFGEEIWLFWVQSTDDLAPQRFIRYDVYDNGVLVAQIVGRGETVFYGTAGILNTISAVAVDTAGNESSAAMLTIDLT